MTGEMQLQGMGLQALSVEEQRALVGGGGWIAKIFGWAVGVIGGGVVNLGEFIGEAAGDFVNGFEAGYNAARP